MRLLAIPLALLVALAAARPKRRLWTCGPPGRLSSIPNAIHDDRQAVGEVKPRYESDLSFRVAGKVLARRVDVGASVRQGDTLATLDTQDFQNRLRSAEAEVASAEAELVEAQGNEARKAKLLKDGLTPQATYDTALRNLRSAEARRTSAKANLDLTRDQLRYTELKADFDGVITAVGAEPGQNVNAGQMVVKLARPGDKDAVFNIAETAFTDQHPTQRACGSHRLAAVQSGTEDRGRSTRDLSRRRLRDTHLYGQSNAQESAAAAALRHEYRRSLEGQLWSRGRAPPVSSLREERLARRMGRSISAPAASR